MSGATARKQQEESWRPDPGAVDAIVKGRHGDPFAVLGMHARGGAPISLRVFWPGADKVEVIESESGECVAELEKIHEEGFFACALADRRHVFRYRLRLSNEGASWEAEDPYRFPPILGAMDLYLLGEGNHRRLYERLGAHPCTMEGVDGTSFAVWAPNAQRVSVVGEFNNWDGRRNPMRKRHDAGMWEIFLPDAKSGQVYKYEIVGPQGEILPLKADPVGFQQEMPPATGSRIHGLPHHEWSDAEWMAGRTKRQALDAPISIYEVHLGSWRRKQDNEMLSWEELGDELIPYVTDMGFTHIECLPVGEHPFAGSWGYQPIGLFSPTSRFGTPEDFARFVERCHHAGLGVIVDWVPAHFPTDAHGLARFDGTALYEHEDPRLGFHRDWNTLIYNYGRTEVSNFLQANATFWLDKYHVDALRVDAVASMLYLDYSREEGQWVPNRLGGRENLEAIEFLRRTNIRVFGDFPGATTMAEESTSWPQVSRPVDGGGLGFGYKWNMGWMHDTLEYMRQDPVHRRFHHDQLTFGLLYAFSENFILPLSHDEVVHGKGSLIGKMPGDRWQKFANLRAYFGFMWTHPGKKLLFMGGEFGQEREWNHDRSLDWHLLGDDMHAGMQRLVRDLNGVYRSLPSLHRRDVDPQGFEWINAADRDQSVLAYLRKGEDGDPPVLVVSNFTPIPRENYRLGVSQTGRWTERMNTDAAIYGGSNVGNAGGLQTEDVPWYGRPASLSLTLPPLATIVLEHSG